MKFSITTKLMAMMAGLFISFGAFAAEHPGEKAGDAADAKPAASAAEHPGDEAKGDEHPGDQAHDKAHDKAKDEEHPGEEAGSSEHPE